MLAQVVIVTRVQNVGQAPVGDLTNRYANLNADRTLDSANVEPNAAIIGESPMFNATIALAGVNADVKQFFESGVKFKITVEPIP